MEEDRVLQEVEKRCPDERLPCSLAFQIAKELGVTPLRVGQAANELGIKIVNCQLGCFGHKPKTTP
ncbi:MAG: hypothetical protein GXP25_17355 [Planctomycetes bacterium]|nr:hypothetical protein [Planctomycetota bacterium]